jgi:hypothetical protein
MKASIWLAAVLLASTLTAAPASASVVRALAFGAMVDTADVIFVGEVVGVESQWVATSSGRAIVTRVTFLVERTLKGEPRLQHTLEFLGGRVGDVELTVPGVPSFSRGDRDVICAHTGRPEVSPIVGMAQGRFRVNRDPTTGESVVTMHDGYVLSDVREIGQPRNLVSASPLKTLTLNELADTIVRTVAGARR